MNIAYIQVNGHGVKVTTDQEVTQEYLAEVAEHVRRLEAEPATVENSNVRRLEEQPATVEDSNVTPREGKKLTKSSVSTPLTDEIMAALLKERKLVAGA